MKKPGKERKTNKYSDVLIIGAGIAGLSLGIKIAQRFPEKKVVILSKDKPGESNTRYAQGGIAVVKDLIRDTFQQHIADTLEAGDGVCNVEVVTRVVQDGPERLKELMEWGTLFDGAPENLELGLEGGHSFSRIVHAKDETGFQIIKSLLRKIAVLNNVEILWSTFAVDLLMAGDSGRSCMGATYISFGSKDIHSIQASFTILATGGVGQVYKVTTNPKIATGDGIAMAYRAGAKIVDMQFVQFHPTAFNIQNDPASFLISEALRGAGARLITEEGNRFVFKYDRRGEMAPRDIVSRAIYKESLDQPVFMDCRHLDKRIVMNGFPNIYQKCLSLGVDITIAPIPVVPAAHYLCGGIATNLRAQTSINKLYAIGECACTGLHGANRLASNSLLEAIALAHYCFKEIESQMSAFAEMLLPDRLCTEQANPPDHELEEIRSKLKQTMSERAGIIRTNAGLKTGLDNVIRLAAKAESIFQKFGATWAVCETRNLLIAAQLVLRQSLEQKENKGTFYNQDLQRDGKPEVDAVF